MRRSFCRQQAIFSRRTLEGHWGEIANCLSPHSEPDKPILPRRPSFIDLSVALAASIFSGVALATTIGFAANLGITAMAILPNITGPMATTVELTFVFVTSWGRKLIHYHVSGIAAKFVKRFGDHAILPEQAKMEVVEVIPKNIKS